jgi:UDP-3-O-[3-hydroxymyristoyl] glucosamine N-acyltransferase
MCWTAVYYCPPIYHFVLSLPWMKWATFRLFGYRGSLDVTIYPDTWIRDLPLLELGRGAYLANKATIGTNVCLPAGKIVVAPVCIGRDAMVGHLAMLGPGVVLGDRVEIGVGAAVGIRTHVGARSTVGPCSVVYHGVRIGTDCHIGGACNIGAMTTIADGVTVPFGTLIPPRSEIRTSDDVERLKPPTAVGAPASLKEVQPSLHLALVTGGNS